MIVFKLKDKSGMTFIDTLIALVIFLTIVLFVGNFQIFLKTSTINMDKKITFLETVNHEIAQVYETNDWASLTTKTVSTDLGDATVTYSGYTAQTPMLTKKITVKLEFNSIVKEYDLERSVFYDK